MYLLELSYNLKKQRNHTITIDTLRNLAYNNNCENFYVNYEFVGQQRKLYRHHCILTIHFSENEDNVCKFIKQIKNLPNNIIYVESLSYDDIIFKLIYVSKTYLNIMEKEKAKEYLSNRKKGIIFKYDSKMVKEILKK
tara:strand:- start:71 stop:484 length:414 start_codon:yes stop_codon:yes gene_type:complete